MNEKKKHTHDEEIDEIKAEAVATPESADQVAAEMETLKRQVEEAAAKVSEYKDSWLRSQAEFQNYKKRLDRDNELMYASMKGDIIKKVLPALDDLERAMQNVLPRMPGQMVSNLLRANFRTFWKAKVSSASKQKARNLILTSMKRFHMSTMRILKVGM